MLSKVEEYNLKMKRMSLSDRYRVLEEVTSDPLTFVFLDVESEETFEKKWKTFLRSARKEDHSFRTSNKKKVWQDKLHEVAPGRFVVRDTDQQTPTRIRVKVEDLLDQNKEFWYDGYLLLKKLRDEPDVSFFLSSNERSEKITLSKIELGITRLLDGKTARQVSKETGYSYTHVIKLLNRSELSDDQVKSLLYSGEKGSSLDKAVSDILRRITDEIPVVDKKLEGSKYRPDFLLPYSKVIIEADGLYYHREELVGKNYHRDKRTEYETLGYRSLFLREDEILTRPSAVESVIRNALGLSTRFYARNTRVEEIDASFFSSNHLMGKGRGRCIGLLHNGTVVAGMQLKSVSKQNNLHEISRFCSAPGVSVVGGFSKLVSHYLRENPLVKTLRTFVDLRYGTGTYLSKLGWSLKSCNLSFCWAKGSVTFHRMKFPGYSGFDEGYWRVWDCGQAKWELKTKRAT